MAADPLARFFRGEALYGDDFTPSEIARWFEEEADAYSALGAADRESYRYMYHALNHFHGFSQLPNTEIDHVLGLGSAWGLELLPLVGRAKRATILDPALSFADAALKGLPITYRRPNPSGIIDLPDASVDLVVCFGVLHHIPNVRFVLREIGRVLRPGRFLLLREPVVSMGDWRHVRRGLTKNERGIPYCMLHGFLREVRLDVVRAALVDCAPMTRVMAKFLRRDVFNSRSLVIIDAIISMLTRWNLRYHAVRPWQKIRPTSAFLVARKSPDQRGPSQ
jgi:SAM-dependent methyltransferase